MDCYQPSVSAVPPVLYAQPADVPSDAYMANWGILVLSFPLGLGVDASGVVDSVGSSVSKFTQGDHVCGCTRLGSPSYTTVAEYFLMDEQVTIPKPKNLDTVQAATLGVGAQTACLGLFDLLGIDLPGEGSNEKVGWVVVLGGASSVGKSAVQIAKASGYQVIASCSSKSNELVEGLGAETFDYKVDVDEQVERVLDVTGGKIVGVFDAAASDDPKVAKGLFGKGGDGVTKKFSTTNDWSGIQDFEGGKTMYVELGHIGRGGADELNKTLEKHIPVIVRLVEDGKLKTSEYEVVGNGGFEDALKAFEYQGSGKAGSNKVVVKVQNE